MGFAYSVGVKIEVSPEMQRFNQAVQDADWCLGYKFDRLDVALLVQALRVNGYDINAARLEQAAAAINGTITSKP